MALPFAVVKFTDDSTYSEIPVSWLFEDNQKCRWPKTKNIALCMRQNQQPESNWTVHNVEVETFCSTIEKARKIAEDANYSTSCDDMKGRGKREKRKKIYSDDSDTSEREESPPSLTQTKTKSLKTKNSERNPSTISCNVDYLSNIIPSQVRTKQSTNMNQNTRQYMPVFDGPLDVMSVELTPTPNTATKEDLDKVLNVCSMILLHVKNIDSRLKQQENSNKNTVDQCTFFEDKFPILNMDQLNEFEMLIQQNEIKSKFIDFIQSIGGRNEKELVHRVLKRTFTDKFAMKCSWQGKRNNICICNLKCIAIMKNQLVMVGVKEMAFESITSEWFRLSKLRFDRQEKKKQPVECDVSAT